jgi:hypothetical protein
MTNLELTRKQIDEILIDQIGSTFKAANKKTVGRLVRSLLRLAARFELSAGHSKETYLALAAKAVVDVEAEMATEKKENN